MGTVVARTTQNRLVGQSKGPFRGTLAGIEGPMERIRGVTPVHGARGQPGRVLQSRGSGEMGVSLAFQQVYVFLWTLRIMIFAYSHSLHIFSSEARMKQQALKRRWGPWALAVSLPLLPILEETSHMNKWGVWRGRGLWAAVWISVYQSPGNQNHHL